MFEGFDARYRRDIEARAAQACWIINYTSQTLKRAIKPTDLVNFDSSAKEFQTSEEAKTMIDNLLAFQKTKCWTKIPDKFAKKQD